MVQYFPWQPSEPLSTQGPTITDVKGECKVQMRDSSHLVWLWPLNRNSVGRGADTCSTWQKTRLWFCCINLLVFIMVKRGGIEGRVLGSSYEFHDHPTSWRTLLVFCKCTWVQISHLAHKDLFSLLHISQYGTCQLQQEQQMKATDTVLSNLFSNAHIRM